MDSNSIIKIENMDTAQLIQLCFEATDRVRDSYTESISRVLSINKRNGLFEEEFRIKIGEFSKDDLHFIYIRGCYDRYSVLFKEKYTGKFPKKNKDDISNKYNSAHKKIIELFEEYYTPCDPYDLSNKEIDKFHKTIKTMIENLELTEANIRTRVKNETTEALHLIGLTKTSIAKILAVFRSCRKEDPLVEELFT